MTTQAETCDRAGCNLPVSGHVLREWGALALCDKHLAEENGITYVKATIPEHMRKTTIAYLDSAGNVIWSIVETPKK